MRIKRERLRTGKHGRRRRQALTEVNRSHEEVTATMLRAAYQALVETAQQPLDEHVPDRIFHRFCISE